MRSPRCAKSNAANAGARDVGSCRRATTLAMEARPATRRSAACAMGTAGTSRRLRPTRKTSLSASSPTTATRGRYEGPEDHRGDAQGPGGDRPLGGGDAEAGPGKDLARERDGDPDPRAPRGGGLAGAARGGGARQDSRAAAPGVLSDRGRGRCPRDGIAGSGRAHGLDGRPGMKIRDGDDLAAARARLGLSITELAERLPMEGEHAPRHLREMEMGTRRIGGPIRVAVQGFLKELERVHG